MPVIDTSASPQIVPAGPWRLIDVDGTFNFRDLGGRSTTDGRRVATGRLYRSASLGALTEDGLAAVEALGMRTVIDLRSQMEIDKAGRFDVERVPVRWVNITSQMAPPTGPDDPRIEVFKNHPDPFSEMFKRLVTQGHKLFADAITTMAEPDAQPLVFHCASGKDRTGLLAVLVQLICGVDLDDVLADFEYSTTAVREAEHELNIPFPGIEDIPPEKIARLKAADPAWVRGALSEIGGLAGLDAWFDSIGIDATVRDSLRRQLLVSD